MAKLIYSAHTSIDGYVADEKGNFDWVEPDDDMQECINERERTIGTYLFGRRLYETMSVWETADALGPQTPAILEYEPIWRAAEKIVYSTRLRTVSTARTRIERSFQPDLVRELKAGSKRDLEIGGPTLASFAIRAGLVDEYHLLIAPIILGSGNPYLPDRVKVKLELLDERRFGNGTVYVRYRPKG